MGQRSTTGDRTIETLIRAICNREKLKVHKITRLSGGQVNDVFCVDGKYVVRIGKRENTFDRLRDEAALLQSIEADIPVPKICALGQYKTYAYQVQAFVDGVPLHHRWLGLSPGQKNNIVAELASYLRKLHETSFQEFGAVCDSVHPNSWRKFCEDRLYRALEEMQTLNLHIPPLILHTITDYFDQHKHVLETAAPVLVHRDLWLGNILIKEGKIAAILDFEFAVQAPRDYELLLIEQFCLYPNDFAEDDNGIYTTADFADFLKLLKKHYPELFARPNLRKRLDLYHIVYSLRAYLSWCETLDAPPGNRLPVQPLMKVFNFLAEHGTRMF